MQEQLTLLKADIRSQLVSAGKNGSLSAAERAAVDALIAFLNRKTGRSFRTFDAQGHPTNSALLIAARLRSGVSFEKCRGVIARQVREWKDDPRMAKYLRPATLFNATNFENYLGMNDADV